MNRVRIGYLLAMLGLLPCPALLADAPPAGHPPAGHPPAGQVWIVDVIDQDFATIQAAIDQAPVGGTVLIGAGRYNEWLKITQPISLIGAGPQQTVIGPTEEERAAEDEALALRFRAALDMNKPGQTPEEVQRCSDLRDEIYRDSSTMIQIDDAGSVVVKSLRVTSPGPYHMGHFHGFHGIWAKNTDLRLVDCAVVGCRADCVVVNGKTNLSIEDCLIGGCWDVGVAWVNAGPVEGSVRVTRSEIRNGWLSNVTVTHCLGEVAIRGCRIWGSAHDGAFLNCQSIVRHNAVFANDRVGISAAGDSSICGNVIAHNDSGILCPTGNQSWLTGNLFLRNKNAAVRGWGSCAPMIRHNVFVGDGWLAEFSPQFGGDGTRIDAMRKFFIRENLFWEIDEPVVRRSQGLKDGPVASETMALRAADHNRQIDPLVTVDANGQVVVAEDSPARDFDFAAVAALESRWPLTPEERPFFQAEGVRGQWLERKDKWSRWPQKPEQPR